MPARLLPSSLTWRFGLAAAGLAAAALMMTLLASVWLINRQHERALQQLSTREREFHAETVASNLRAVASRMSEIASSTILATGLVDSAGRETYLVPFLAGIRQVNGLPVQVLFTDFEGKEIAGNGIARFEPSELEWLRSALAGGKAAAVIAPAAAGPQLLAMQPMTYARTNTPEGAILYKVPLSEVHLPPAMRLEWGPADAGSGAGTSTALVLPALFQPLRMRIRGPHPASAPGEGLFTPYLAVFFGGLVLVLVIVAAGARLARLLTRDVRDLEAFSRRVIGSGLGDERAPVAGSAEIASLARSINEMLDRLEEQHVTLLTAARRKDEFLAMLAHELRNPLAPIATGAELIRLRAGGDANIVRMSEVIGRQASHMTRIVDDLLDVSRVTRGLVRIERVPVDVGAVVREAIDQVTPLLESRRHHLSVDVAAGAGFVTGDHARLVQVVANLLNNAAKYTPAGGRIAVSVAPASNGVTLTVEDNGSGIPAELLPDIFDLFTQGHRSADRAQGGLGLGLALVKNLIGLHGGRVNAASEGEGRGARLDVWLPRGAASPAAGAAPDAAERAATRTDPLDVLVVDDNEDAAETLATLLQLEGHRVEVAHDGDTALAKSRLRAFDAFVLDVGLPGMSGIELARLLAGIPSARNAVKIALTGYGQSADREKTAEAGFDHHLVKPVEPAALHEVLREAAARRPRASPAARTAALPTPRPAR